MTLEQKIQQQKRQIPLREKIAGVINYVAPFINSYNPEEETDILVQDQDIQKLMQESGIKREQLTPYLIRSRQQYRSLLNTAIFADTTDRFTSVAGLILESITGGPISPPAFGVNLPEETLEGLLKLPFYFTLRKADKSKIKPLLMTGIGTSAVPIAGDFYDILTHKYMTTAKQVIREKAKEKIMQDYNLSCQCFTQTATPSQYGLPSLNGVTSANPTKPL